MGNSKKSHLILQNLYELRKLRSITERQSAGRIFFIDNTTGICDASGIIWPIGINDNLKDNKLHHGDFITFKCKFINNTSKETDTEEYYFIQIIEINSNTPCLDEWKNTVIPNPLPSKEYLLNQIKQINTEQQVVSHFFISSTFTRLKLIRQRNRALDRVNLFFINRGFLSIETPTLVPSGGIESYLTPFNTVYEDHRGKKWQLQLPTSPEFALKKIMTEGTNKIYQLSRAYRNRGEVSNQHEPEFIMLEWYRANATLQNIIDDTQNLVKTLAEYLGTSIQLPKEWPIFRVDFLFQDLLGINLEEVQNTEQFYNKAKNLSPSITENDDWDCLFYKLFMEKIEPFLLQQKACFVTHYPIQMGALAAQEIEAHKINEENKEVDSYTYKPFVERMEAFLCGIEICNGYYELNDAHTIHERFQKTIKIRPDLMPDPQFENAMQFGLPPCSGNALGIDRVIAILLGLKNISSLYPIPFLSQFPNDSIAWE